MSATGLLVLDYGEKIAEGASRGSAARSQGSSRPTWVRRMLLEVRGLEVRYGGIRAVKGIDLAVEEGELVCLIGANGAARPRR